jgi:hypothetical protein
MEWRAYTMSQAFNKFYLLLACAILISCAPNSRAGTYEPAAFAANQNPSAPATTPEEPNAGDSSGKKGSDSTPHADGDTKKRAADTTPDISKNGSNAPAVVLDSAHPTTAYRNPDGTFNFEILGQNFSDNPEENEVYIKGLGPVASANRRNASQQCSITDSACLVLQCAPSATPQPVSGAQPENNLPCLLVVSSEKLQVIGYKREHYQGPIRFIVRVRGVDSGEKTLVLSRMSEMGVVVCSLAIFLILAYIIYLLVARGMKDIVIDGQKYSPFWSFFIDKATNTYSLSKFQLFAFSAIFVYGYLYVFLCRWLVQWQFVLPDVPSNVSGLLAIGAGTTVAAAGATSARGSKGGGQLTPSAADFITTGGQVVPERFQFFVWTLVACLGFIALLVSQDPATIQGVPNFPDGLLYVMGVSATGYLAGKVTRPPGPVIRNIAWDKTAQQLITQGENLSKNADFFVDGKMLPIVNGQDNLVTATPQEQASDRSFCSELKIKIITSAANLDLSTGDHIFRIVNKDAQFADARFTADPPVIDDVCDDSNPSAPPPTGPSPAPRAPVAPEPVAPAASAPKRTIHSGKSTTVIKVAGDGFRMGTTAKWTPANTKDPVELAGSAVQFVDSKTLKLSLVPGDPGPALLAILMPDGFVATATVTVV